MNQLVKIIGHRGCGMNSSHPMFVENTIASFEHAYKVGANCIEFDIQLTKDLVPVVFHDWTMTHALDQTIRIHNLTLNEFLAYASPKSPFTILSDMFKTLDQKLAFNIEIKYVFLIKPLKEEVDEYELQCIPVSEYVSEIVKVVKELGASREIFYSSFHPDACIELSIQQNQHEIYFLTGAGKYVCEDKRCNSYDQAMQLCVENKLAGIVSHVDPLIEDFKVVSSFQSRGFKVMTFGGGNTVDRIIKKQKDAGVNGIITDDIPLTKKILET